MENKEQELEWRIQELHDYKVKTERVIEDIKEALKQGLRVVAMILENGNE